MSTAVAICEDAVFSPLLPLRDSLRSSTTEVHERLHVHRGFAAVQAGTIDCAAYTSLLCRLYGFYKPFEIAARITPQRTQWLESDLTVLGIDTGKRLALSQCIVFPKSASPEYLLGARYVVEGSALGGRGLARQLDTLVGKGVIAGRRFFSGHGAETGTVWRDYLARLSAAPTSIAARTEIITGATATFAMFEQWLEGWDE